jgi:hypothetical protein
MAEQHTTRTIADIERRAEEIKDAELDAIDRLIVFLRELAVELPSESKLPLIFADKANKLSNITRYRWNPEWAKLDLDQLADEWGVDSVEEFVTKAQRWIERSR